MTDEQRDQIVATLRQVDLFSDLSTEELRALAEIVEVEAYRPGQQLYRQSDADGVMFVLTSGRVALYHVDPQGVESFAEYREPGPGGWLGEAALLLGEPRDVTALVVEEASALEVDRKAFQGLLDKTPGLREKLKPRQDTATKLHAPKFGWQAEDETVVIFIRKHPWALFRSLLFPIILLAATLGAAAFLSNLLPPLSILFWALAVLVPLPVWLFFVVDWRNDFYVLTDRRLVHEENVPIIRQKREEAPLSAVQDVYFARNTLPANVFNYGDLTVETFSGAVEMRDVPDPENVKDLIFREIERVGARTRATVRKEIYAELRQRLGHQEAPATSPVTVTPVPPSADLLSSLKGLLHYFTPRAREVVGDSVVYRKHWIVLVRRTRILLSLFILSIVGGLVWWNRGPLVGALPDQFWILWIVLIVAFFLWLLWRFEDWRNDLYILTSTRVIDIERVPFLLQETRKEAGLDRIQTSEIDIPTPLARVLGYGDVIIRVAGAAGEFRFAAVSNPRAVQTEVSKRVDQFKRRQAANEERQRRTELSDWFATYDEVKSGYRPSITLPPSGEQTQNDAT